MRKVLLVAWREFWQLVRSRAFIVTSLGLPVLMIGIWTLSGTLDGGQQQESIVERLAKAELPDRPVGYVDHSGKIQSLPPGIPAGLFTPFTEEAAAAAALKEERIEAYFVVSADYAQSGEITRVSLRLPLLSTPDRSFFAWVLNWSLAPGRSAAEVMRLRAPLDPEGLSFVPLGDDGAASGQPRNPGFAPFLAAIAVTMPLFMAGGYLLQGLAQEKENRIIEILLVSLAPWQLLAGKLIGLGAVTILQLGAWFLIGGLTTRASGRDPFALMASIDLSGSEPVLFAAFAAGGFLLYATLMAGLGAIAPNIESTRMWAMMIGMPMWLPIVFWSSIVSDPNSSLAVTLSILPFCSPVAMIMRLAATTVAGWEVALSLVLLAVTSVAMLLLMSRLFRAGTLLSGQPISARRFWEALRA